MGLIEMRGPHVDYRLVENKRHCRHYSSERFSVLRDHYIRYQEINAICRTFSYRGCRDSFLNQTLFKQMWV